MFRSRASPHPAPRCKPVRVQLLISSVLNGHSHFHVLIKRLLIFYFRRHRLPVSGARRIKRSRSVLPVRLPAPGRRTPTYPAPTRTHARTHPFPMLQGAEFSGISLQSRHGRGEKRMRTLDGKIKLGFAGRLGDVESPPKPACGGQAGRTGVRASRL